ncbi:MAG TPA: division/cell wall cluster transcriptional repressor MraZ [Rhodocyclaceae bacterium]|nr:division/cell wall cluster transcriptional repressor MraZ [Rhodocyclaceae bacterium]
MFQGAAALSLDAKGRLAIPARHRDALMQACGGQLVVTGHPHRCLMIYPSVAWKPIRDQVLAAPGLDPNTALFKRLLVGFARDEEMDSSGRVLVAPELRQFAEFDKQVWLVGQGSHFELWSENGWQKQQQAMLALLDAQQLPAGLETLAL